MPIDKMLGLRRPRLERVAVEKLNVATPDGQTIAAYAWGNPEGREIVFMHGYSQCYLSWRRQIEDLDLAREFRMVAYDLRGHGASSQPTDRELYKHDQVWADDLKAVIEAAGMKKPTLVAWSYAGRIVADYARLHGQANLAGVNYVAASTKADRKFMGPGIKYVIEMASDDLATNVRAARMFVHACFAGRPAGEEMDATLGYTMLVPAKIRAAMMDRTRDTGDMLPQLKVPVLASHGSMDRIFLPAASHHVAAVVPGAKLSIYDGIGHSPFYEDPKRFNRELAEFARGTG
jgi:pimeloyl-ACP methyl ester carboxylesterase